MSRLLLPHHDGSEGYVSNPAPALGETVAVFVRVPAGTRVSRVHMRWVRDGEPVFTSAVLDRRDGGGDWWRAELEVRNPVTPYRFLLRTAGGAVRWLTGCGVTHHDVPDATDFRLVAYAPAPAWARDAVVYQIFPDRFAASGKGDRPLPDWAVACDWDEPVAAHPPLAGTQVYGGDLDGVTEHLDHIADLGANTLYLTPFFPATSNHRYDSASFDHVDPLLGGDQALVRLSEAVHGRGMRLIGDLTTNHTGDAHPWFPDERDLYYFTSDGGYESWLGVPSLPKLNWGSHELRRRFARIAQHWLTYPYALDGWRIDVANMTGRRGAEDWSREAAVLLRRAVQQIRPDALLIGEHAHDATGDLDRNGWQGTMNYAGFTRPVWSWLRAAVLPFDDFLGVPGEIPDRDAGALVATMSAFAAQMSWRSWTSSWQMLGSHDTPRIRSVVGDATRHEIATGLLCTLPGTPMIFAGDELGLTGVNGEHSRTPMPWRRPETWDRRTLGEYHALLALRRARPALRAGGLRWAHAAGDTLAFLRESRDDAVLVVARRAAGEPLRLAGLPAGIDGENLYGGADSLKVGTDGCIEINGDGPTFQVWSVRLQISPPNRKGA
ncbi:alpha-glycosidase [Actinoplanes ianthinogenes]|uniref:Alpha-glycosidase n=1 Tax=Actinoplanes ianthinogenes TaxID=122358 RepID=A0ABN6CA86_9ACTN|nr:glycoside hydrolase family 13 protein [Actinoplanes ianthinogenes]BCJ41424.1 alpha-glycosidase [Actinoplanes ianthinogenes]GGR30211.1 alpha-glycosidase [Actinoplanes ianthinogenes]